MKSVEILKNEHQTILKCLEKMSLILDRPIEDHHSEWMEYFEFIKTFADDYHHTKEEEIFFEWMRNKQPALDQGPLACMLKEHDMLRDFFSQACDAFELFDEKGMRENLSLYISALREHISKEDNILYMIAEDLNAQIGDADEIMLPQFRKVEAQFPQFA